VLLDNGFVCAESSIALPRRAYELLRRFLTLILMVGFRQRLCKNADENLWSKIDRLEHPASDDRHLGNGFGTPNFSASLDNFEFLHRLDTKRNKSNPIYLPICRH
jgi:hypothetical protein